MKHFYPNYSTQKVSSNEDFWIQKIKFLKSNSQWVSKGASVGTLIDTEIFVKKTKGIQKFILFQQNKDNSFLFPLIEAASLLFSKKLIILSLSRDGNIFAPSGHFIIDYLIRTQKITFKEIKLYFLLSRLSASSRKPSDQPENEKNIIECKKIGYSEMIQNERENGPKSSSTFHFTDAFPITQLLKIPSNYRFPENFAFSLPSIKSKKPLSNKYSCVPVNLCCLVSVSDPPQMNYSSLNFV